jgi:hypothetical protein
VLVKPGWLYCDFNCVMLVNPLLSNEESFDYV